MKISIEGSAKVVDGGIAKSRMIGQGSSAREHVSLLSLHAPPPEGWDSVLDSTEPYWLEQSRTSSRTAHTGYAAGKSYSCQDVGSLSEEEQALEVANAVFRHEKRYKQLQR